MKRIPIGIITLVVVAVAIAIALPCSAFAGSGDYCSSCLLKPYSTHVGNERPSWIETESWNSNGEGVGSCTGVGEGGGYWEGIRCVGDISSGYDEVYCYERCKGIVGYHAQMEDNSKYTAYFTGWEWWSESLAPAAATPSAMPSTDPSAKVSRQASIPEIDSADFAALGRTQTAADLIPASEQIVFSESTGANPALARRVVGSDGTETWIIPGNGSICIQSRVAGDEIGGATCAPTSIAVAGELRGASASGRIPGVELVGGLAPNGISDVTFTFADGHTQVVPVHHNVYQAVVHGAVTEIDGTTPTGQIAIEGMPASSASARVAVRDLIPKLLG